MKELRALVRLQMNLIDRQLEVDDACFVARQGPSNLPWIKPSLDPFCSSLWVLWCKLGVGPATEAKPITEEVVLNYIDLIMLLSAY